MKPKRAAFGLTAALAFLLLSMSMCNFTERGVQGIQAPLPD